MTRRAGRRQRGPARSGWRESISRSALVELASGFEIAECVDAAATTSATAEMNATTAASTTGDSAMSATNQSKGPTDADLTVDVHDAKPTAPMIEPTKAPTPTSTALTSCVRFGERPSILNVASRWSRLRADSREHVARNTETGNTISAASSSATIRAASGLRSLLKNDVPNPENPPKPATAASLLGSQCSRRVGDRGGRVRGCCGERCTDGTDPEDDRDAADGQVDG